jgi:phosphosulfolactate phosphohydrolase-like enzyme
MTASRIRRVSLLLVSALVLELAVTSASAEQVSREQDIVNLRLGQRILVDDGSCAAGQIKEVFGTKMTGNGILRAQKCVPRLGPSK